MKHVLINCVGTLGCRNSNAIEREHVVHPFENSHFSIASGQYPETGGGHGDTTCDTQCSQPLAWVSAPVSKVKVRRHVAVILSIGTSYHSISLYIYILYVCIHIMKPVKLRQLHATAMQCSNASQARERRRKLFQGICFEPSGELQKWLLGGFRQL